VASLSLPDCLFCKIARKEVDADVVHESDSILLFRDINPMAPVHVLAIPKEHIDSAADLGPQHAAPVSEMLTALGECASNEKLERGYRIVTNVGPDAGQSVEHLHFHLLGGRYMKWPPG
jgi:histidine triad (HIT) family protein